MAYDRFSILREYPEEITHILEATKADPKDEAARLKVATTLARALSFTKRRTGEDRTPADTEVYRLATVIGQARNREEFELLLREAMPKAKPAVLEKYDFAWTLPWEQKKQRRSRKEPDLSQRIDAVEKALRRIEDELSDLRAKIETAGVRKLAGRLDEVLQKLKAHRHDPEGGRAYIIEKREL